MLQLNWIKSTQGNWLGFHRANLNGVTTHGVYIIWHAGNPGRVVRVGQGDIAARLNAHRQDQEVCGYAQRGELYVTWASVAAAYVDGVERYLADTWDPLVGDAWPDCAPMAVNSPW
jgi:hypothetical protein